MTTRTRNASESPTMRIRSRIVAPLLAGALLAGCVDLDITNPNEQTVETFWQDEQDAILGVNAAYSILQGRLGAYGRWLTFAYDMRSDIGWNPGPWGELSNFTRTIFTNYNFEPTIHIWTHHYEGIFRANQVIAYVPGIQDMNPATRDRIVGEARFIRALLYFNLVNLYGNVPLATEPLSAEERAPQATPAEVWALIEQDLTEARAVLPAGYDAQNAGRATRGAANALLGRAHLQQKEWQAAADAFALVINSGTYSLVPDYQSLFRESGDNGPESIFEVQFGDVTLFSQGIRGYSASKMMGLHCDVVSYFDAGVRPWYFQEFMEEPTVGGGTDPRLDATLFWNKPGGMMAYNSTFAARCGDEGRLNDVYWKKHTEFYKDFQDWENPINFKVMRLGGILLLHAEALSELNRPGDAKTSVDRVRARASLAPLPAGMSKAQMDAEIEHQILLEMGLEHERYLWLKRHDWLTDPAKIAILRTRDEDFQLHEPFRALLPIPSAEVNLNSGNVTQNPGW